ncbi:ISSpo9, transposase [Sulfitobacter guttiformis KCTC 32187]|nr:ISSpo9, transposase [Sulfitobacter guttiformis KCTC 32187]
MAWEARSSGRRGRQQTYSDQAIHACLTLKVLFGLPLRQTTGFVESLLKLVGLDWSVPDFSTLCRRHKALAVAIPYKGSAGPLHLLVDSTGNKAEGEGEWNARKHGGSKRRLWRKIHIGIDEEAQEIRAIEVTSSSIGPSRQIALQSPAGQKDAPMLPDLLSQIAPDQELGSVTADGAYDIRKCYDAIAARNAHAAIPPRKTAKMWKPNTPGARARNEAVRSSKYLGRSLWRNLTGYYRRSRVETKPLGTSQAMPCRSVDALCKTAWPAPFGARLRASGCRGPDPRRDPQRLHSFWHTPYCSRRLNPSG